MDQPPYKREWSDFQPAVAAVIIGLHVLAVWGAWLVAERILYGQGAPWGTIVQAVCWYFIVGVGISAGNHRLFSHDSFAAHRVVRATLLVLAPMTLQGSTIKWASDHRRHHQYADKRYDPHSPFAYRHIPGWWGVLKGIAWAHVGWTFYRRLLPANAATYHDLVNDPMMRRQQKYVWMPVSLSFALPALFGSLGGLAAGQWRQAWTGALMGALIAGALRIVLFWHATWAVNSVGHLVGKHAQNLRGQVYRSDDSRNAPWILDFLTLGELLHGNHHWQPKAAVLSMKGLWCDPTGWLLIWLEYLSMGSLVSRVKRLDPYKEIPSARQQPAPESLLWGTGPWKGVTPVAAARHLA